MRAIKSHSQGIVSIPVCTKIHTYTLIKKKQNSSLGYKDSSDWDRRLTHKREKNNSLYIMIKRTYDLLC